MWIEIERGKGIPIIRQLYDGLYEKITSGELSAGERMPSSRELAAQLGISRNTVVETYEQLEAEGFLKTYQRSGTFVESGAVIERAARPQFKPEKDDSENLLTLRSGIPELGKLPIKKWLSCVKRNMLSTSALAYGATQGLYPLRREIAQYLARTRGLECDSSRIIITTGAMAAFHAVTQCFDGGSFLVEDPSHSDIRAVFQAQGNCVDIPVDEDGICTDSLPENISDCLIYVTPSHQYPLGGVLPIQRRIELIKYARTHNSYIIEDDYDSEYRYRGTPVKSMCSLSPENVIYVSSFSKTFYPSSRIGYMVLPEKLVQPVCNTLRCSTYYTDGVAQLAMADFLKSRYMEHHIAKMKKLYMRRRDHAIDELKKVFGDKVILFGIDTGLHLCAAFDNAEFTHAIITQCRDRGLCIYPAYSHAHSADFPKNILIIGYSHLEQQDFDRAVLILKSVV